MKLEIKMPPCTIVELYDAVATEMGYRLTSEIKYNCTKINVAENIQDNLYEYYITQTKAELAKTIASNHLIEGHMTSVSESEIRAGVTMLLLMSGPKVNKALKVNEVEVFDGFIIESEV